eukprot:1574287-Amphidinium_carterae.1
MLLVLESASAQSPLSSLGATRCNLGGSRSADGISLELHPHWFLDWNTLIAHLWIYIPSRFFIGTVGATSKEFVNQAPEPVKAQSPLSSLGATWVAAASLIAHLWNYFLISLFIGTVCAAFNNESVNLFKREPSVIALCVRASASRTSLELHPQSFLHWNSGCYLQRVRQPRLPPDF